MVSHDQKGHVAPHFDCLELRNSVIPFMMPLASCDTDSGPVASHDQKVMLHLISNVLT